MSLIPLLTSLPLLIPPSHLPPLTLLTITIQLLTIMIPLLILLLTMLRLTTDDTETTTLKKRVRVKGAMIVTV
jgi:hypothetical protein